MRDFNNNNRFGGSRGGSRFGGRGNSGGTTMHDAVCAECGNNCKVPFFPSGNKPVYCSNCFEQRDGGDDNARAPRRNNFDRPQFSEKRNFSAPRSNNQDNDSKKFDQLNAKLDKVIKTLNYMINLNKDGQAPEASVEPNLVSEIAAIMEEENSEVEHAEQAPIKAKAKKPRAKKVAKAE